MLCVTDWSWSVLQVCSDSALVGEIGWDVMGWNVRRKRKMMWAQRNRNTTERAKSPISQRDGIYMRTLNPTPPSWTGSNRDTDSGRGKISDRETEKSDAEGRRYTSQLDSK